MWLYDRPIAHRGLHDNADTENSMGAFRKAIEKGYNIETDVHILKSGEVVIFHDFTLKRVCGKNVKITDLTLDDIKGNDYLLPNGEHIPLLSELLEIAEGKTGILLEIKINGFNYNVEKAVLELIKGKENFIAVQAFNPWTIAWFRQHAPEFTLGILSDGIILPVDKLMMKKMRPDFIAYNIKSIGKCTIKYIKKKNLKTLVWTVRKEELFDKAVSINVDNIIFEHLDPYKYGYHAQTEN